MTDMTTRDICLEVLKVRLANDGKVKSEDKDGNIVYTNIGIIPNEKLNAFLELSLSEFNSTPRFTTFSFDEKSTLSWMDVLIEGATINALASQAFLERGREYPMIDNGVSFSPPNISDLLMAQWHALLPLHFEKLKLIK